MIDSIEIRNYRNLKELKINSFARINLITGKNNVGKSSLLEAIIIYISKASLKAIYELLDDRGENYIRNRNTTDKTLENNIKAYSSLFSNRQVSYKKDDQILISGNDNGPATLSIRFVRFIEKEISDNDGDLMLKRSVIEDANSANINDVHYGLEINTDTNYSIRPLERIYSSTLKGSNNDNFQYIRARNIDAITNDILWDKITLTDKEASVIEALRIIEPDVDGVAFIQESSRQRKAVIKLKNTDAVIPISSMGDGINRILTIILALVNAENSYLLIDEFENGLHHSVQRKLWDIIFTLSEKLNVQVFATTHSNDTINSFQQALNSDNNKTEGKLIRLDNKKGQIKEVAFSAKELNTATNQNIEIR